MCIRDSIQLGQTTKADKENHGLGVRNILDAVKHAGGQVQWNLEEDVYKRQARGAAGERALQLRGNAPALRAAGAS